MMVMKWTEEMDAQLLELRGKGINLTQIGKIMGMTKNSIVGRNSRLVKLGKVSPIPKPRAQARPKPIKQVRPKPVKQIILKVIEPPKPKKPSKPPIIDAHPAYDHLTGKWFLDTPRIEAGTIAELIKKLPEGSTIKDYKNKVA